MDGIFCPLTFSPSNWVDRTMLWIVHSTIKNVEVSRLKLTSAESEAEEGGFEEFSLLLDILRILSTFLFRSRRRVKSGLAR